MNFLSELETRLTRYTEETVHLRNRLVHLDGLIIHIKALVEEERRQCQLPLAIAEHSNGIHQANGSEPQPVSEAMYDMLAAGPTRYSNMVQRIPIEYPRVHVGHVAKGLSSALRHGQRMGRVQRLARGLYALK